MWDLRSVRSVRSVGVIGGVRTSVLNQKIQILVAASRVLHFADDESDVRAVVGEPDSVKVAPSDPEPREHIRTNGRRESCRDDAKVCRVRK